MYDHELLNKSLNYEKFTLDQDLKQIGPNELYELARKSKGIVAKISERLNRVIPFHIKRLRAVNKLFFGSLENYPGPGNSPLFRREVIQVVKFRKLANRIWPSFMGRGADRDFNFEVAETFKNSYVFFVPLYLWNVDHQNIRYPHGIEGYIID